MRDRGDFLEWAEVHGNFYGTSRVWLEEQMQSGRDMLLEIDWQGAQQVRRLFPRRGDAFSSCRRRLPNWNGACAAAARMPRMSSSAGSPPPLGEMRHVGEFDFVIINNDLQVALDDLAAAVRASRLRVASQRARQPEMFRFLEQY